MSSRALILSSFVAVVGLSFLTTLLIRIHELPPFSQVKRAYAAVNRAVVDRSGRVLDELPGGEPVRRLQWVELEHVSPALRHALGEHFGLALELVELLDGQRVWVPHHAWTRAHRHLQALALRMSWTSANITEAYLNMVRFRGELQGVAAASSALWDKHPSQVTRAEAALMRAMRGEHKVSFVQARQTACEYLDRNGAGHDCALLGEDRLRRLEDSYNLRPFVRLAPHVLEQLPQKFRDGSLHSTLDRDVQWTVLKALSKHMSEGAALVLDNATGQVMAYVGHSGPREIGPSQLDAAVQPRSVGTMLIPLLFAKALEEKIITMETPLDYASGSSISARQALSTMQNLAAVRVLELVGSSNFVDTLKLLGLTSLRSEDVHGPSLALGSTDVRLTELTNAYRTLASSGRWAPLRFSLDAPREQAPRQVFSLEVAHLIQDALAHPLTAKNWTTLATSSTVDDDWAVGSSDTYTVGVWATGAPIAASVWNEIMQALHAQNPSRPPRTPEGLVRHHNEWFLAGTELARKKVSRFIFPKDQAEVLLDPEIPRTRHRLFIQIAGPRDDQQVYLNQRRLGRAQSFMPWDPEPGTFQLELRDSRGRVLDRVRFEVRGRRFALAQ